ncbi:hypothetical protein, partial [Alkalibacterium kapii]|uniref:hypothetical protein n=1 Tax=Alkalibacterium kapii TaxID=426704 RepID=UPI001C9A19C8
LLQLLFSLLSQKHVAKPLLQLLFPLLSQKHVAKPLLQLLLPAFSQGLVTILLSRIPSLSLTSKKVISKSLEPLLVVLMC